MENTKNLTFTVKGNCNLSYGQKIYHIAIGKSVPIKGKCPTCDDSGVVIIREKEFPCPACQCGFTGNRITNLYYIQDYNVEECFVCGAEITGPRVKASYTSKRPQYSDLPEVKFFALSTDIHKSVRTFEIKEYFVDQSTEKILNTTSPTSYCFTTKKAAIEAIKALKEKDKALLEKFNKAHGTNHKYPFEKQLTKESEEQ